MNRRHMVRLRFMQMCSSQMFLCVCVHAFVCTGWHIVCLKWRFWAEDWNAWVRCLIKKKEIINKHVHAYIHIYVCMCMDGCLAACYNVSIDTHIRKYVCILPCKCIPYFLRCFVIYQHVFIWVLKLHLMALPKTAGRGLCSALF